MNQSASNESTWKKSYPYKVDYCDHFETPLIAYKDIAPLLDLWKKQDTSRDSITLYDPYYCNGRTTKLLAELGFTNVKHERRDFYKDVKQRTVPLHNVFITNPPYSDNHKEKCIQIALEQLRSKGTPFFILIPNYIASKDYYRKLISENDSSDSDVTILYLVPPTPYEYDHPDGTGSDVPPFSSIWYCGMKKKFAKQAKDAFPSDQLIQRKIRLYPSVQDLIKIGAIPPKRPNPKQRKKKKGVERIGIGSTNLYDEGKTRELAPAQSSKRSRPLVDNITGGGTSNYAQSHEPKGENGAIPITECNGKKSRHRGPDGARTKKRF